MGVTLFGGFAGNETQLQQRNVSANPTILDGDLVGDDQSGLLNRGDNVYHVVVGTGMSAAAVLDGFTIRGGQADAAFGTNAIGGGLWFAQHRGEHAVRAADPSATAEAVVELELKLREGEITTVEYGVRKAMLDKATGGQPAVQAAEPMMAAQGSRGNIDTLNQALQEIIIRQTTATNDEILGYMRVLAQAIQELRKNS